VYHVHEIRVKKNDYLTGRLKNRIFSLRKLTTVPNIISYQFFETLVDVIVNY